MSWQAIDDVFDRYPDDDDYDEELEALMSEPTRVEGIPGGGMWQDENGVWHRIPTKVPGTSSPGRVWYNRDVRFSTFE